MRGHVQNFPQVEPESRPQATKRLNSWKEIASFFEKDVRTMHRWEAERGLPVHRVPGPGRGRVFAYTDELERWLNENPTPAGSSAAEVPAAEVVPSEAIIAGNPAGGRERRCGGDSRSGG